MLLGLVLGLRVLSMIRLNKRTKYSYCIKTVTDRALSQEMVQDVASHTARQFSDLPSEFINLLYCHGPIKELLFREQGGNQVLLRKPKKGHKTARVSCLAQHLTQQRPRLVYIFFNP